MKRRQGATSAIKLTTKDKTYHSTFVLFEHSRYCENLISRKCYFDVVVEEGGRFSHCEMPTAIYS